MNNRCRRRRRLLGLDEGGGGGGEGGSRGSRAPPQLTEEQVELYVDGMARRDGIGAR